MFKALDLDQNDSLDWKECKDLVQAVMKQDGGYNALQFKARYDAMDKNADGKISKDELVEACLQVGRERNLFGAAGKKLSNDRPRYECAYLDDPSEEAVDVAIFREGLSCLGKTFNNARHAYLKLAIPDKTLSTLKVTP